VSMFVCCVNVCHGVNSLGCTLARAQVTIGDLARFRRLDTMRGAFAGCVIMINWNKL
jgi:hypothetical protein